MILKESLEREKFLSNRKQAEMIREMLEGLKRRKIHDGVWTAENAEQNLQQEINKIYEKIKTDKNGENITIHEFAERLETLT